MARNPDPTQAIKAWASSLAGVTSGTSCNQTSFKVGKTAFLYIGPGAKGIGFKAMFKLGESIDRARALEADRPDRYGVGKSGWVSVRFSAEEPLPKSLWEPWLRESFALSGGSTKPAPAKKATAGKQAGRNATAGRKARARRA